MERVERRELPGNDASWYREFLVERDKGAHEEKTTPGDGKTPSVVVADSQLVLNSHDAESDSDTDVEIAASEDAAPAPPSGDVPEETTEEQIVSEDLVAESQPAEPDVVDDASPAAALDDADLPLMTAVPPIATDGEPADDTSEMVGKLWTASESDGPIDTWEPDDMNSTFKSSRSFRWTSVLAALAVLALIVVGLVLLPSITRGRADAHSDMYSSVLSELRRELPDTQESLEVTTDPQSTPVDLEALATQLTALAAKASAVDEAAQADLPDTPPFTSSEPIDQLEPIRQRLEPMGSVANTIQRRIANLVEYRTLMAGFLDLPELPDAADSDTQAELRLVLAAAQAESASILAELPSDVSLDAHSELARTINDRFATWQVDYLEALRTEDTAAAQALLAELDTALTELDNALVTPLAQIRRQTDTDLIDLARSIDEVLVLIDLGTQES